MHQQAGAADFQARSGVQLGLGDPLPVDLDPVARARSWIRYWRPYWVSVTWISACWREMPGSLIRRSARSPRPITIPGGTSGWRIPFTSSTSSAVRIAVELSRCGERLSATASERTRKCPVCKLLSSSNCSRIGPLKT